MGLTDLEMVEGLPSASNVPTMELWEADRYDWTRLKTAGGDAAHIPRALEALQRATAACLVIMLSTPLSAAARVQVVELLQQLIAGTVEEQNTNLVSEIAAEVGRGFAHYAALLQLGNDDERDLCIELVALCAIYESSLVPRAKFYLHRLADDATASARIRTYARSWLEEPHLRR
jgi:hypothetical protein